MSNLYICHMTILLNIEKKAWWLGKSGTCTWHPKLSCLGCWQTWCHYCSLCKPTIKNLAMKTFIIQDLSINDFIGCVFEKTWWIAKITAVSLEDNDISVSFMHPHGPWNGFRWPKLEDLSEVPLKNVLHKLPHPPFPLSSSGRFHTFGATELQKIELAFSQWM